MIEKTRTIKISCFHTFAALIFGWRRSPVVYLHGVQGVAGSNRVIPTFQFFTVLEKVRTNCFVQTTYLLHTALTFHQQSSVLTTIVYDLTNNPQQRSVYHNCPGRQVLSCQLLCPL